MRGSDVRLLPLVVLLVIAEAYPVYVFQTGWSGGPGIPGPVTSWGTSFSEESNTAWDSSINDLFLGISSTQHVISNNMQGCRYAFAADMDGDGDLDAVASEVSTLTPYKVAWFENDGNGSGWDMHIISENYAVYKCAYPADIDHDGDIDVIGCNNAMGKKGLEWLRNDDGVGDSWTRFRIAYWGSPKYACSADLNGDDTLEVIAPSWGGENEIAWFESTTWPPDSSWTKHSIQSGIEWAREVHPIDLDQDGDIDILSATEHYDGLRWHENLDGLGLSWSNRHIGGYYDSPYSAHAADIDGDGDIDVVFCDRDNSGQFSWFENLNGIGTSWEKHEIDADYYYPQGVWAVDMTDDGHTDILLSGHSESGIYVNMDGSGTQWARHHICNGSTSIRSAELNGDGKLDILTGASTIYWHELEGNTDGWLLSSILDVTSYPQWDSVTWIAEEPAGTDIFFQVRASNDWEDMGAWCDTLFEPQSLTGVIDSTFRYIQYRVGMTSDTEYLTPILEEVRFYWTFLGIEGGEGYEEFEVTACPNPASSSVNIAIPAPFIGSTEIFIYDISGKLIRSFSGLETNCMQWDCRDNSGNEIPSGLYLVQAISEEKSRTMRLTIL